MTENHDEPFAFETIKFADRHEPKVLTGQKTATVRYDGFEHVTPGDVLLAANHNGGRFATIEINGTAKLPAGRALDAVEVFYADHNANDTRRLIRWLNEYYDERITEETLVTVLAFEVIDWAPVDKG